MKCPWRYGHKGTSCLRPPTSLTTWRNYRRFSNVNVISFQYFGLCSCPIRDAALNNDVSSTHPLWGAWLRACVRVVACAWQRTFWIIIVWTMSCERWFGSDEYRGHENVGLKNEGLENEEPFKMKLHSVRAAVGMGIPMGIPMGMGMGWVWELWWIPMGTVGILWEFSKRICDWSDCDRSESFLNFVEYSQIMNVF